MAELHREQDEVCRDGTNRNKGGDRSEKLAVGREHGREAKQDQSRSNDDEPPHHAVFAGAPQLERFL